MKKVLITNSNNRASPKQTMTKVKVLETIRQNKLIPLLTPLGTGDNWKVAGVLQTAGLPIIEITLRDKSAFKFIEKIKRNYPTVLVGAGTVINKKDAKRAVDLGCDFLVAPGFDEKIIKWCQDKKVTIFPGVMTPTEVQKAYSLGLKILKFFPAQVAGGEKMLKALSGPFSFYGLEFIPTGGVNETNFIEFLKLDNVFAVGGSFIIDKNDLRKRNWARIKKSILQLKTKIKKL